MGNERRTRRVLGDHRQFGKRFVPPFTATLGRLNEVSWLDMLPELLWLGMLNDRCGRHGGAALSAAVGKAFVAAVGSIAPWPARTSAYATMLADQAIVFRENLRGAPLADLHGALRSLVALYPACPLRVCWDPGQALESDARDLAIARDSVDALLIRDGDAATFAQANAIYIAFVIDKLKVAPGLALANFPAIEQYPHTEDSKRIASAVRATVNGLSGEEEQSTSEWTRYFWRRGLELSSCELAE